MVSPKCFICKATFKHKRTFHLVTFRKEPNEKKCTSESENFPTNWVWFCELHAKYGEIYSEHLFSKVSYLILNDWKLGYNVNQPTNHQIS